MLFSIIIPCYKVEPYIRACLDSILAQTVNDPNSPAYAPDCWEAICTDDGSPDGTGKILDEYALREKVGWLEGWNAGCAKRAAERKVHDWLVGVDAATFENEVERFIVEGVAEGIIRLRNDEEMRMIAEGAVRFFREFSRTVLPLSDGRYAYFVPDARSRDRGVSNARAWAEYAVHAVTNGGEPIPGKEFHVRWYNHRKVENFDLIVDTLQAERCAPILRKNPIVDSIKFFGETHDGGDFDVVVRLDEFGNAKANMTEVTFEASKTRKRFPRLKPLSEAVETVVCHQAAGTNPSTVGNSIANPTRQRKGGRIKVIHQANAGLSAARNAAMAQATGEWLVYLDSDDLLSPWALETYLGMIKRHPTADIVKGGISFFKEGESVVWKQDGAPDRVYDLSHEILLDPLQGYFVQMIFKRSVFGDIPFVGMSWCEERPYVAKCIVRCREMVVGNSQCYGVRRRIGSITRCKMKIEQWKGCLAATREVLEIYCRSEKKLDGRIARISINRMLEQHIDMIYKLLRNDDRNSAWTCWFGQLSYIAGLTCKTKWQAFVVAVCRIVPFRIAPLILCYLPQWLKCKGIHR